MERLNRRRPQGQLAYIGKKRDLKSKFHIVGIKDDELKAEDFDSVYDVIEASRQYPVFWVHISGLEDTKNIEIIGKTFQVHHLFLQDTLNTLHVPKAEQLDDHLNVIFKSLAFDKEKNSLNRYHLSAILGEKYLISFSETELVDYDHMIERMNHVLSNKQPLDKDRIFYILLDVLEDGYTSVLEGFENRVSRFELEAFSNRSQLNIERIYKFKRLELRARKSLLPAREVVSVLMKQPNAFISQRVSLYFKDLHGHLVQITDSFETLRETLNGVIDIGLSREAEKTNQVVKILTILSTIFLPLNFIAGVFGMNFGNMPLLQSDTGFTVAVGIMGAVSLLSLLVFYKKGWL